MKETRDLELGVGKILFFLEESRRIGGVLKHGFVEDGGVGEERQDQRLLPEMDAVRGPGRRSGGQPAGPEPGQPGGQDEAEDGQEDGGQLVSGQRIPGTGRQQRGAVGQAGGGQAGPG